MMLRIALCVLGAVLTVSPVVSQDMEATLKNINKVPIDIRQKFGVCAYQTIAEKVDIGQFSASWLKDPAHGGDFFLAVEASCGEEMVAFADRCKRLGFAPKDISNMIGLVTATAAMLYADARKSR